MVDNNRFLAFDLGAESGRAVVGTLQDGRLSLEEISRFPNTPVQVRETLYWDVLALYNHILEGLREYVRRYGAQVEGIGIDTWGVDFGLLSAPGELLQNPVHYRDARTTTVVEQVKARISPEELFRRTGMALLPINTSVQLLSLRLSKNPVLDCAATMLMMPDLFAYFLTGRKCCERTNAVSTQLLDRLTNAWSEEIVRKLDLSWSLLPELVDPGTVVGELLPTVREATGLKSGVVIAPCTHDTASAVAAVPGSGDDWAFLSCGTWSVVGTLTSDVVATPRAYAAGVFNELTVQSRFLCRNIIGLWLLQQARAAWMRAGESYSYEEIAKLAAQAPEDGPLINPDAPQFLAPRDMQAAIEKYCAETGQAVPHHPGETARCILESLAFAYHRWLEEIAALSGRTFRVLHKVGGGVKNSLLCQLTANATGLPVLAGPSEATVAGNIMVQALAKGIVKSPQELRDVIRRSSELVEYRPQDTAHYQRRFDRYMGLAEKLAA
jgi:rhamnulokinase